MQLPIRSRPSIMFAACALAFAVAVAARIATTPSTTLPDVAVRPMSQLPSPTEAHIAQLQDRLHRNASDGGSLAQLGWAYLQRARENADASLYDRAERAFAQSLALNSDNVDALAGHATLAATRHEFSQAIDWAEQARTINPYRAQLLGIIADAQVELGRYDDANASIQNMVNLRPDIASYSRVAYLRELHGDVEGAADMMRQAVASGNPQAEGTHWAQTQLGNLYFNRGDMARAEKAYRVALELDPGYAFAIAGVARVRAAQGKLEEAADMLKPLTLRMPLPEFVIALGEVYEAMGKEGDAKAQFDLVRAMQQLFRANGVNVDLELTLFDAERLPDPSSLAPDAHASEVLGAARSAFARRPTVQGADMLAWALFKNGATAEAKQFSDLALRLGTRDATMHYHAGRIALALGDKATARAHLQTALDINPHFSLRHAPIARTLLTK